MLRFSLLVLLIIAFCTPIVCVAEGLNPHERLALMWEAAENLEAAGLEEEANEIRKRAEQMEVDLRGREQPDARVVLEHLRDLKHQLEELKSEVRELRAELRQVDRRPQIIHVPQMISPNENGQRTQKVPDAWNLNMPGIRIWPPSKTDPVPLPGARFTPHQMIPKKENPRKSPENGHPHINEFHEEQRLPGNR